MWLNLYLSNNSDPLLILTSMNSLWYSNLNIWNWSVFKNYIKFILLQMIKWKGNVGGKGDIKGKDVEDVEGRQGMLIGRECWREGGVGEDVEGKGDVNVVVPWSLHVMIPLSPHVLVTSSSGVIITMHCCRLIALHHCYTLLSGCHHAVSLLPCCCPHHVAAPHTWLTSAQCHLCLFVVVLCLTKVGWDKHEMRGTHHGG